MALVYFDFYESRLEMSSYCVCLSMCVKEYYIFCVPVFASNLSGPD